LRGKGIRIGAESCARILPEAGEISNLISGLDPECSTLVTPVADPDEVGGVLALIDEALATGLGEIVVNDWGVLGELSKRDHIPVTAGRLLLRLRRGPGADDRWESLDDASRRYFSWGPLFDSPFLGFLLSHGVGRLEVDCPRHWIAPPPVSGMRLSLHCGTRLVAISGACPWLYDPSTEQWAKEKGCGRRCVVCGDLRMEASRAPGPLVMRGKAILERVEEPLREEDLPESIDRLIYEEE